MPLAAPSRFRLPPGLDVRLVVDLWADLSSWQKLEIMNVDEKGVLYELSEKYANRYGCAQAEGSCSEADKLPCLEAFSTYLEPVGREITLKCVRHLFDTVLLRPYGETPGDGVAASDLPPLPLGADVGSDEDERCIVFSEMLLQTCITNPLLGTACYSMEHDRAVYQFFDGATLQETDRSRVLELCGVSPLTAYALTLYLWSAANLLLKRLSIAGMFNVAANASASSVATLRSLLDSHDRAKQSTARALALKLEGNDLFKAKQWKSAREKYSEAIRASTPLDESRLAYHSNRALCSLFLAAEKHCTGDDNVEYLSSAVLDCTQVLRGKPFDIKALYRRAR
eukprot:gene13064-20152_t